MDSPVTRRRTAVLSFLLLLSVAVTYREAGGFAFIDAWDDGRYVTLNPAVRNGLSAEGVGWAFTTFSASNWHPISWISHMADVELFGLEAGKHHLVNVLLHGLNGLLLFVFLTRATGRSAASAFAAALFLLHPTRVESVAWIAERKDLLSAFFVLLSVNAYHGWCRSGGGLRYASVIALFACSLLSKPMYVTLPVLLLVLDHWPLNRRSIGIPVHGPMTAGEEVPLLRLVVEKVPLMLLSLASSFVTLAAQSRGGAVSGFESIPAVERLSNSIVAASSYLWMAFLPVSLSPVYLHPSLSGAPIAIRQVAGCGLLLVGVTAACWFARRSRPWLLAGWTWYLVSLVPVIGLVQVGVQGMADRYTYLPLAGVFVAICFESERALRGTGPGWRRAAAAAGIAVLLLMSVLSTAQARWWVDGDALFGRAVALDPRNWMARHSLGGIRELKGDMEGAEAEYRQVVKIRPDHPVGHAGLGVVAEARGDYAGAKVHYGAALALDPAFVSALEGMGNVLLAEGDWSGAASRYLEAARSDGGNYRLRNNLGYALLRQGKREEALAQYRLALSLSFGDEQVRRNLETALAQP